MRVTGNKYSRTTGGSQGCPRNSGTCNCPVFCQCWQNPYCAVSGAKQRKRCQFGMFVPASLSPWTVACQSPLSVGFPRQEYWSGLLVPTPTNPWMQDIPIYECLLSVFHQSLQFSLYKSFTSLVKLISKYFIFWLHCKWDFKISFLISLFLVYSIVYRNTTDFYMLILHPVTLLNLLINSNFFVSVCRVFFI